MRLYYHYCSSSFSNCYILGTGIEAEKSAAVIVDPGNMDAGLLNIIESHDFWLLGVFLTHDHSHHVQGLKTIMRIYDTKIYSVNPVVSGYRSNHLRDGDTVNLGPFKINVISVPGHSADSAVYKADRFLFTGDAISAGLLGSTASSFAAATQINALRSKIFSLPGDYTILPGHGPPTSLETERRLNLDMNSANQKPRQARTKVQRGMLFS